MMKLHAANVTILCSVGIYQRMNRQGDREIGRQEDRERKREREGEREREIAIVPSAY